MQCLLLKQAIIMLKLLASSSTSWALAHQEQCLAVKVIYNGGNILYSIHTNALPWNKHTGMLFGHVEIHVHCLISGSGKDYFLTFVYNMVDAFYINILLHYLAILTFLGLLSHESTSYHFL